LLILLFICHIKNYIKVEEELQWKKNNKSLSANGI